MPKEKTAEQKITFVEIGKVELNIRVPNLIPKNVKGIVRDIRRTLENCANLNLLDEFAEEWVMEYKEILEEATQ